MFKRIFPAPVTGCEKSGDRLWMGSGVAVGCKEIAIVERHAVTARIENIKRDALLIQLEHLVGEEYRHRIHITLLEGLNVEGVRNDSKILISNVEPFEHLFEVCAGQFIGLSHYSLILQFSWKIDVWLSDQAWGSFQVVGY
nr:hypothetical protein [Candidatus Reidiella endopervernicosa]